MEHEQELDPQRVCTLVLARLLPESARGHKRAAVVKSVVKILPGVTAAESVGRAWKLALEKGWIEERGRLTEAGSRELGERLGAQQLPKVRDWPAVQRALLGRLALGMAPAVGKADFAADVVCAAHSLPVASTARAVVDRLAWRALGLESDANLEASGAQRGRTSNDRLRGTALRRWVAGTELVPAKVLSSKDEPGLVVTGNDNTNRSETSLERFAAAVVDAARKPGVTRFHDDRAFIGSIWEHMRGREPVLELSLDEFKEKLVQAHRQKLLRMSRADLVQAMDPAEVARSEARYLSATFHFVALQAGGAR